MPLVIKVSVSRKLTEDFNSRGWTLDIQSEFDPRVFDDTDALANSTNHLFALANDLLDQQVREASEGHGNNGHRQSVSFRNGGGPSQGRQPVTNGKQLPHYPARSNGNGHARDHKGQNGHSGRTERPITSVQINAIAKMAERFDTNGDTVAQEDFGCKMSELTIRQASDLIDRMKKALEGKTEQGVAR